MKLQQATNPVDSNARGKSRNYTPHPTPHRVAGSRFRAVALQNIVLALGLAGTGLISNVTLAAAATYQLNNVHFDDGAIATGTFDFNPPNPLARVPSKYVYFSNWNITISGGNKSKFPVTTYNTSNSGIFAIKTGPINSPGLFIIGNQQGELNLVFATLLTGKSTNISLLKTIDSFGLNSSHQIAQTNSGQPNQGRITGQRNVLPGASVSVVK